MITSGEDPIVRHTIPDPPRPKQLRMIPSPGATAFFISLGDKESLEASPEKFANSPTMAQQPMIGVNRRDRKKYKKGCHQREERDKKAGLFVTKRVVHPKETPYEAHASTER
jgi:hypothetical protein